MPDRLAGKVRNEILFRNIGDIFRVIILGEEMIVRLILGWPDFLRNRKPPIIGIAERRVDVENDTAKGIDPVLDDLTELIFGYSVVFHNTHDHKSTKGFLMRYHGVWPNRNSNLP